MCGFLSRRRDRGPPRGPELPLLGRRPGVSADPAHCEFYVVPYMKAPGVGQRPLAEMTSCGSCRLSPPGSTTFCRACSPARGCAVVQRTRSARGEHGRARAHADPRLAAGRPRLRTGAGQGEWHAGFHPALADKSVLIVGYGSIGSAIEDRLTPFEVARVARVARSERTTARGPVHPLTELPALLPEADIVVLSTPSPTAHGAW